MKKIMLVDDDTDLLLLLQHVLRAKGWLAARLIKKIYKAIANKKGAGIEMPPRFKIQYPMKNRGKDNRQNREEAIFSTNGINIFVELTLLQIVQLRFAFTKYCK